MKFSRAITACLVLVILIGAAIALWGRGPNKDNTASVLSDQQSAANAEGGKVKSEADGAGGETIVSATRVRVTELQSGEGRWLDALGIVKANDQIKVFASAAGQIQSMYADEGASVKAGDPLFLIGGLNGARAAAQIQLETAQKSYSAALQGLELTISGNQASLTAAELQLMSARHAAEGYGLDMQVFDQNINAARTGEYFLQDSYNATVVKNDLDLEKTRDAIDNLQEAIDRLEEQKAQLEETGGQEEAVAELAASLEELYGQLDTARIGYEMLEQAKVLTENQLLGQIAVSENQGKVLYLTQLSTAGKLGLSGGVTDAVRLAEAGLEAVKIKNEASLLQAQTQSDLAKANLEIAQIQADSLIVRAPVSGTVGEILARPGDLVSQQSILTQVSGLQNYELRAAVDAESAALIETGSLAEVEINGRHFKLPVKNIGTAADAATRLVNITVALPRVKFRSNQTLRVRLPVKAGVTGGLQNVKYIPLDAVIIGTEEQFVYTADNGKAVKKNIKTGDVHGDSVQVLEGLSGDDSVIVDGARSLVDGQDIEII